MIKLISLEGFLSLSSGAVKKIENALRAAGLEATEKFDDIDDFLDAVIENIDEGSTVILAAENEEYNSVKKQLIDAFSLRKGKSEEIQDAVFESRNGFSSVHDLEGHCLVPTDGDIYVTGDGLYSGFCVEFSNDARMILLPLDESRLDDILPVVLNELKPGSAQEVYSDEDEEEDEAFESGIFAAMVAQEEAEKKAAEPEYNDSGFASEEDKAEEEKAEEELAEADAEVPAEEAKTADEEAQETAMSDEADEEEREPESIPSESEETDDVFSCEQEKQEELPEDIPEENPEEKSTLTLKNGEELIIDDTADEADLTGFEEAMSAAAKAAFSLINLDKTVAFVASENSPFLLAMCKETEGLSDTFKVCEVELENEDELDVQVAIAKKTRLAIRETGAQLGAAISPVIKDEKDGKDIYYSYIVIHDGSSAKAKKISTSTQQGIESLIPHAFSVMFGLVERKAESIAQLETDDFDDDDSEGKKRKLFLAVCVVAAVAAIISAVAMVMKYFNTTPEGPSLNPYSESTPLVPPTSDVTAPTTGVIPSVPDTTDPVFHYPAEPTASDVSVIPTSTPFSSTKGTFTFTVYGYGHGVGMSQNGANYYAGLGRSYLEILAMYYYGATLVLQDTVPETVTYDGTAYPVRDYVATAVESEMGGSFAPEALKAQAVAVFTFAKYYNFDVPKANHAFSKTPSPAAYKATDEVLGQYMTYEGQVIRPFYHATSACKTTSYANAFGDSQIPYLAGGRPSYGDINAENYCTTVTYTSDELNALIYSKTGKTLSGDPANWFKILSHDACINENTGYVSKIQVGDQIYSGNDFRIKVLGGAIRSHCFTFIYTPTA